MLQKSPVKQVAEKYNLTLSQPENKQQLQQDTALEHVDVLVVAAYGMVLPPKVLKQPRYGCINVHTSLLPRWRGAAPVQRAILAGDSETGISIIQMDEGLDTGDILYQQTCPILGADTAGSLLEKMALIGSECTLITLDMIRNNHLHPQAQSGSDISYAQKILKSEALIDWHRSALEIDRQIRAFNPAPVTYMVRDDLTIRVWQAEILRRDTGNTSPGTILGFSPAGLDIATSDYAIRILKLQLPGKKVMDCRDFYNGNPGFWNPDHA